MRLSASPPRGGEGASRCSNAAPKRLACPQSKVQSNTPKKLAPKGHSSGPWRLRVPTSKDATLSRAQRPREGPDATGELPLERERHRSPLSHKARGAKKAHFSQMRLDGIFDALKSRVLASGLFSERGRLVGILRGRPFRPPRGVFKGIRGPVRMHRPQGRYCNRPFGPRPFQRWTMRPGPSLRPSWVRFFSSTLFGAHLRNPAQCAHRGFSTGRKSDRAENSRRASKR